jgi:hypothetical protein
MIMLLEAHQDELDKYPIGSVELHFHRDERQHDSVRAKLHVNFPD